MPRINQAPARKSKRIQNYSPNPKRLAEVRKLQKSVEFITSTAAFGRITREVMATFKHGLRLQPKATEAIQTASEDFLHKLFRQAECLAAHAGRNTITVEDLQMVKTLKTRAE